MFRSAKFTCSISPAGNIVGIRPRYGNTWNPKFHGQDGKGGTNKVEKVDLPEDDKEVVEVKSEATCL